MVIGAQRRILHVTEALGGGITTALVEYARSTPELEHHLLSTSRGQFNVEAGLRVHFASVTDAGRGWQNLALKLRSVSAALAPHVVHLHSAWAGLLGRLVMPRGPHLVVYSPHSFFFERQTLSASARRASWRIERLLASRTDVAGVLTPHEAHLAHLLGLPTVLIPNVVRVDLDQMTPRVAGEGRPRIVTIGRLSAQKGPDFYLAVVASAERLGLQAQWLWVGDGDPAIRAKLAAAGVQVTGWCSHNAAMRTLADADLYLHTAAWEGSPMTVLEAVALKVPVVARSIPSLTSLGLPGNLTTASAVACAVKLALDSDQAIPKWQRRFQDHHAPERQGEALRQLYREGSLQAGDGRAGSGRDMR